MNINENKEIERAQRDAEVTSQWGPPISLGYINNDSIRREVKCQLRQLGIDSVQYLFPSGYILSIAWSKERGNYTTHLPGGIISTYEVAVIFESGELTEERSFVPLTKGDDVAGWRTAADIKGLIQMMMHGATEPDLIHYFENH